MLCLLGLPRADPDPGEDGRVRVLREAAGVGRDGGGRGVFRPRVPRQPRRVAGAEEGRRALQLACVRRRSPLPAAVSAT